MFNGLIEWSARNRIVVLLLAGTLLIWGAIKTAGTDMDVLPEFSPPQVVVETDAPGMVAEEVESLISVPLETAINGTPGVTLVKSISQSGVSLITVIFQYGTDVYLARQLVNEKIQLVQSRLPTGARASKLLPVMSAVGDILKIGMVSDTVSPMELRTLADWDVRNRLLSVPGVSRVYVMGGQQKQYLVSVDPERLRSFKITLDAVRAAVEQANVVVPGGNVITADKQFPIRAYGRIGDIDDLANSVITTRDGVPVLIKHVAKVEIGAAVKIGDAVVQGKPGVELVITRQPWVNTLEVTHRVRAALEELKRGMPDGVKFVPVFRQATFIERSIENVVAAIVTGGLLVVGILLVFLFNWRTALISLTAIPLSLLSAVLIITLSGGSINTMTLGGLAIAVGEVVDDAIVDVENVYRRLREHKLRGDGRSVFRIVVDACKEVRSSVVYATFVVALVFLPIFSLSGTEGKIFSPLGYSYVVATLSSLVVALTVTPALCVYLLSKGRMPSVEPPVLRFVQSGYASFLKVVMRNPKVVIVSAMILFAGSLTLLPMMGQSFLPQFKEENLIVTTIGLPGQSLEATVRMGEAISQNLLKHSDVGVVAQRAGRAELDDDAGGPNFSEFDIQLKPSKRSLNDIISDVRKHMDELPGLTYDIGSFIQHRMEDVLSGGTQAQIAIKIFGPDLPTLRTLAQRVTHELKTVPGAVDVRPEALVLVPNITVKIDRERAARYGLTADSLSHDIETAFNGIVASEVLEEQRLFALKIWLREPARNDIEQIKALLIDTPTGVMVPLSMVASVTNTETPNAVVRENVTRRIVVQANTHGRDVVGVVNDARERIQKLSLPPGYYIVYAGEYAAQVQSSQRLLGMSFLALLAILVLLRQGLKSWKSTLLVAANLPLATIGGIVAVALTGNVISIGSIIGFISLFGISTRNSLLLVTHINALEEQGMSSGAAIFKGSLDRVGPVLMTALTAALGMLPLAVLGGSGRELEQPLAVVIVGGLVSSTALTLLVIPALVRLYSNDRPLVLPALEKDRVVD